METFKAINLRGRQGQPILISSVIPESTDQARSIASQMKVEEFIPEFRFDLYTMAESDTIRKYLEAFTEEGGHGIFTFRGKEESIGQLYTDALEFNNIVADFDISLKEMIPEKGRDRIIVSSHFDQYWELQGRIGQILSLKPGAVKVACPMTSPQLMEAGSFISGLNLSIPVSVIPMGEPSFLRLVSALAISDFVYTYHERPVAPGQFSTVKFRELLRTVNSTE